MSFIKRYLIALNKYKWVPVISIAATTTAAGLLSLTQSAPAPQYRGQGALALNQPPALFSEAGTQIQEAGQSLTRELLLADNVIEATARQTGIKPEVMAEKLQVSVQQPDAELKTPFLVGINYVSGKPEEAQAVVAALMQGMVQQSQLVNSARLRSRIDEISKRLPAVTEDLRKAEQALEQYNRREEADILSARAGGLVGAIAGSKEQQRQIRLTLEGVSAQIASLENRLGLSADQAYISSALSADPIIANLRAQIYQTESQVEILRRDLRAEHPDVIALNNQLDSYKKLLSARSQEVLGGNGITAPISNASAVSELRQRSSLDPTRQQLANTLVSLQTQRDTLRQQVQAALKTEQELRQEYATIPNKQLEQQRLAQTMALKKALFDRIQAALIDAQAAEAETTTSLRIEQTGQCLAHRSFRPIEPNYSDARWRGSWFSGGRCPGLPSEHPRRPLLHQRRAANRPAPAKRTTPGNAPPTRRVAAASSLAQRCSRSDPDYRGGVALLECLRAATGQSEAAGWQGGQGRAGDQCGPGARARRTVLIIWRSLPPEPESVRSSSKPICANPR
ncbi:MAG: hypothetical protein HC857_04365 [Synechococcales cyanobacterium RU_4_20]|nr:hypothetical protein [Synechococcales cyanobacterium RU_4_20]